MLRLHTHNMAKLPIAVTLLGIVSDAKASQYANAASPIEVLPTPVPGAGKHCLKPRHWPFFTWGPFLEKIMGSCQEAGVNGSYERQTAPHTDKPANTKRPHTRTT